MVMYNFTKKVCVGGGLIEKKPRVLIIYMYFQNMLRANKC